MSFYNIFFTDIFVIKFKIIPIFVTLSKNIGMGNIENLNLKLLLMNRLSMN